ncbi:hypothetical protein [Kitasatospora sp. NRRL B-11411]|uniref:hypothetical protein n=1 Tax=Kitasatospora sp. NRRL B-11411 TaxID=1463822 RepID=UPI0004C3E52B|nr:hypothetical protein [Kitasatospora sp. NRRL B-11411]
MTAGLRLAPETVVAAALLVHQLDRLWDRGTADAFYNFAPVWGVRMPRRATGTVAVGALPAAVTAAALPWAAGRAVAAVLTALWLLSVQRRLANHVWLGSVAVVAMAVLPARLDPVLARDLLIGVYLSAALFKVNAEYLRSDRSAGRLVTAFYAGLHGVSLPRRVLVAAPVAVVVVEAAVGASLWQTSWARAGLFAAIGMHWVFGVSGNFTFSVVALALWGTALCDPAHGQLVPFGPGTAAASLLGALSAAALGRTAAGPRPTRTVLRDAGKGGVFGVLCASALAAGAPSAWSTADGGVVDAAVAGAFAVNLALVVAGLKLEWSFAMFSSLRPFGRTWLDRVRLGSGPRYYLLSLPERIPAALLRTVRGEFVHEVTRPDRAVHELVAFSLERTARRHAVSFSPRLLRPERGTGRLVPVEDGPAPRRRALLFPAVIPRDPDRHYLG